MVAIESQISSLCTRGPITPATPTRGAVEGLIQNALYQHKKLIRADIGMLQEPITDYARAALQTAVQEIVVAGYKPTEGLAAFREEIARFTTERFGVEIDPSWVVVGMGGSECFSLVLKALLRQGDSVATPDPHYANFDIIAAEQGIQWVPIPTSPENNYHPDMEVAENLTRTDDSIKAIYQCSPNNPTGTVLTRYEIRSTYELGKVAIWDSVYSAFNYSDSPSSALEVLKDMDEAEREEALRRSVFFDSMSKLAGLADLRIGWAIIPDNTLRAEVIKHASARGSVCGINQKASEMVLRKMRENDFEILNEQKALYRKKRDLVHEALCRMQEKRLLHVQSSPPDGGIYEMVEFDWAAFDFLKWCLESLKEAVTFVPITTDAGSFYTDSKQGIRRARLCFGLPIDQIPEAMELLENQLIKYKESLSD